MLQLQNKPHDGRAKDGEIELSLAMSEPMVGVERMVGRRIARSQSLEAADTVGGHSVFHRTAYRDHMAPCRRDQRRLYPLLLLPLPCRTQDRIHRYAAGGTHIVDFAFAGTGAVGDRRFPNQAVRTESRRSRHSPQSDARAGRPEISLRTHLSDDFACLATSEMGCDSTSSSSDALRSEEDHGFDSQKTWLEICHQASTGSSSDGVDRSHPQKAGKTVWVVIYGGYTKLPFLKRTLAMSNVVVVGRLRKDTALRNLPLTLRPGQRRPRKYGNNKISLAKRAAHKQGWQTLDCTLYGELVTKTCKTFLATYPVVGGVIRVVLVKENHGWVAFFCTDHEASVL